MTDSAPMDFDHAQQADMASINELINSLDAQLKTARPQDLAALISAAYKARYFRRNMLRGIAKERQAEPEPDAAPATAGNLERARAQAAKLRA